MSERPILFSGPMVTAILKGTKTQTRRVVKPQPLYGLADYGHGFWSDPGESGQEYTKCPYGKPGDRLWVRETFSPFNTGYYDRPEMGYFYLADGDRRDFVRRWRPSIHMPREASRLTLEITSIRAERLQDITEEEAMAEGTNLRVVPVACLGLGDNPKMPAMYTLTFKYLWNSINEKRGGGWEINPWVWVITFKRVIQEDPETNG